MKKQSFEPLREIPFKPGYKTGDVLVVFGEVFSRGYVNGLIDEAKKAGMKVIYSTVGRRTDLGELRPLNQDELKEKDGPLINIPLECGFDLSKSKHGRTPVDQLKGIKLSEWMSAEMDQMEITEARESGRADFKVRLSQYTEALANEIPKGANVLFAHTMAGGVPRAKIIMPVMNRVFKGHGDRYASSEEFWRGTLGQFCSQSFMDVTANSLADLIEVTSSLRDQIKASGGKTSYVAFGYHGTEILINGKYQWQSYSPYLQGFAKLELEQIACRASADGVTATVFNAPEILTNSSSIFLGVEVALYPLLAAFNKEIPDAQITKTLTQECEALLKPEYSLQQIIDITDRYFSSDIIHGRWTKYDAWPQHNGPEQMELMRTTSDRILEMHKDERNLLTAKLSELVFRACGRAMLYEGMNSRKPVWWIGHDLVARLQ